MSIDCTTWTEEEAVRRAADYGDMDGIEMINYRRLKRIEDLLEEIRDALKKSRSSQVPRIPPG